MARQEVLDRVATRIGEASFDVAARLVETTKSAFDELYRECRELKRLVAEARFELSQRRLLRKYSPDQLRVPAGNPDGGQWTDGSGAELEQSLAAASDQAQRDDLSQLQDMANDFAIRPQIDGAWNASNPDSGRIQENGFWVCRDDMTGELFTRPFANSGAATNIIPGPVPSDAVAFFHTHPLRPEFFGIPGPSRGDLRFADSIGLPGVVRSHNGMYYFGPRVRAWNRRSP